MTTREWWETWERCAQRYRLQCTAELELARHDREIERALECRARDARRVVLPHLRKAMWCAQQAERAHERMLWAKHRDWPEVLRREDVEALLAERGVWRRLNATCKVD